MTRLAYLPLATYPDSNSDAVASNAVQMARHLGCGVHAMALDADIPEITNAVARIMINLPEMIRQAESASKARGEQLLARIEEEGRNAGVNVTTESKRDLETILPDIAAMHARYYDCAFCGWEAGNLTSRLIAESMIFGSGRPVILLPESQPAEPIASVAIAWDGSRVAARAVADAEHLLARAQKIWVLTVVDEKPLQEKDPGGRLVASLAERGLVATAIGVSCDGRPIERALQERAKDLGAGTLVMGAFGHSRLRDFVLGGATRGVLADMRMPIMLSH